ncbi:DMT family transporter [Arthrobacter sp. FW306-05-C]|uniref:DMT family transporter n=1 Tax=Arthrobacter sp. FW306-05-C TaxID=2879620 RepID=UPI001F2FE068|nr:DMT family transporter [Arthrobacter sp. FW306-05-C]UKA68455.1 DMT family transporter [Arthrobacter sp. FW306-05-C]
MKGRTVVSAGQIGGLRRPKPMRMLWITFAWGSCFLAISIGLKDAPLLWFAALRALIAGGALLTVAGFRRESMPRGGRTWALIAVMGIVNVTLAFGAMFGGLAGLSTGAASVLANAQPLLIVLPAWWIYKERVSARTLAAMGTGFAGLLAVALPGGTGTGAWLSLTAALAVTAGTLISRQIKADVLQVIAWHFLIGGAILAVIAGLTEGVPAINWGVRFIGILLYVSLVGTAAAFLGWFTEVRHARLDAVTAWTFLVPVFGILLSTVVLGERQSSWSLAGMVLVLVSMLVLVLPRRPPTVQGPENTRGQ